MTILQRLERWVAERPDALAYQFYGADRNDVHSLSFAGLDLAARRASHAIRVRTAPGDRVLIIAPSGVEYLAALFGCLLAGRLAVTLSPPRKRSGADAQMQRIAAVAADCAPALVATTRASAALLANDVGEPLFGLPMIFADDLPEEADRAATPGEDTAFLQYTSGSTRTPRGVMVTHANLAANLELCARVFRVGPDSVMCGWLPLFHDMGLIGLALQAVHSGCPYHFSSPTTFLARPLGWLERLSETGATCTGAPNFAFDLCADRAGEAPDDLDLSRLDMLFCGAEPIRLPALERFAAAFARHGLSRKVIAPGYGLAEATLVVSLDTGAQGPAARRGPDAKHAPFVDCGAVQPEFRSALVDPARRAPVAEGQIGELWLAGPCVAPGYWQAPEATADVFGAHLADGSGPWMRTGDLAFLTGDRLHIAGRVKDVIIIAGQNHLPQDIEASAVEACPSIDAGGACAFEVAGPRGPAVVVAAEVRRAARRADLDALAADVATTVTQVHGVPVHDVVILGPRRLPRTTSGKLQRSACREAYEQGALAALARLRAAGLARLPVAVPDLAQRLRARVAELCGRPESAVDLRDGPARYGLGSAEAVALAGELAGWRGRAVSPSLFFEHPSFAAALDSLEATAPPAATPAPQVARHEPIAIVGIGCRLPGGDTAETFFDSLLAGADLVREAPADRGWTAEGESLALSRGGFLDEVHAFDPLFFGLAPREARAADPQQRLALELAWRAFEDSGMRPSKLAGCLGAVFVGCSTQDHAHAAWSSAAAPDVHAATGASPALLANRISYVFDLRGESQAIDSACSSSLTAVVRACRALRAGEAELALAGGLNLMLSPRTTRAMSALGALSPSGRCAPFSAKADGYVRGEGGAFLVLKRLSDALADGDRIRAVIRGVAANTDGRSNGLTAPNGEAQEQLYRLALADAGTAPETVSYVEAHGTGTPLGDPVEAAGLARVYGARRTAEAPLLVGAVKSAVGHLEAAAGVAGLVKAVVALERGELPPTLHADHLHPGLPGPDAGLEIVQRRRPLPPGPAAVSAFGFGGANAHVILEAAPARTAGDAAAGSQILPLSARTAGELADLAQAAADRLELAGDLPGLAEAARRRPRAAHRAAVVASTPAEAASALRALVAGEPHPALVQPLDPAEGAAVDLDRARRRIALVFPGQGGQWPGMADALFARREFRQAMEAADAAVACEAGFSVIDLARRRGADFPTRSDQVQPLLFAFQVALARLLLACDVRAEAVVGHSLGEAAAAHIAGALSLEDAARVVVRRSRLAAPCAGAMLAIEQPREAVERLLRRSGSEAVIAVENAPDMVVVSGPLAEVQAFAEDLTRQGARTQLLAVDFAAHTPWVEAAAEGLAGELRDLRPRPPELRMFSAALGGPTGVGLLDRGFWRDNLRQPVRFAEAVRAAMDAGCDSFVEIGPHPVLAGAIASCARSAGRRVGLAAPLRRDRSAEETLPRALAELFVLGDALDFGAAGPGVPTGEPMRGHRFERVPCSSPAAPPRGIEETTRRMVFDPALAPYLLDHRVGERPVVPAATLLDGMWAAEAARTGRAQGLALEAIKFSHFTPVAEPVEFAWRDGEWRLVGLAPMTRLARGRSAAAAATPAPVAEAAFGARLEPSEIYAAGGVLARSHGPAMRCLQVLEYGAGAGRARASAAALAGEVRLAHPVLLDGALQALGLTALAQTRTEGVFVPREVARAVLHRPWSDLCDVEIRVNRAEQIGGEIHGDVSVHDPHDGARLVDLIGAKLVPGPRAMRGVPLLQLAFHPPQAEALPGPRRSWLVLGSPEATAGMTAALAPAAAAVRVNDLDAAVELTQADDAVCLIVDRGQDGLATAETEAALRRLAAVARAASRCATPRRLRVALVTVGAFDATQGSASGAGAWAALRVLRHEAPAHDYLAIDLEDPTWGWATAARRLVAESDETDLRIARDGSATALRLDAAPSPPSGAAAPVRANGGYLVVGGASGLGWRIACWLLERGAGEVIVTGRSGLLAFPEEAAEPLRRGVLRVHAADCSTPEATAALWRERNPQGLPLRGVVLAAGVLADGALAAEDGVRAGPVLATKLAPLVALGALTGLEDLDFLLALSSAAATIGSPGQASYATANAAVERMTANLRSRGVRAYSIAWGPWRDVGKATSGGAAARLAQQGVAPISRDEGLAALDAILGGPPTDVAVLDFDVHAWAQAHRGAAGWRYLGGDRPSKTSIRTPLPAETPARPAPSPRPAGAARVLRELEQAVSPLRRRRILVEAVEGEVRAVLGLASPAPRQTALRDLGLDSMMAVEIRDRLERSFGVALPSTAAFDHPTIEALAAALDEGFAMPTPQTSSAVTAGAAP